jgi:ABC-type multidrug transport system fused ATPase/permease subunit
LVKALLRLVKTTTGDIALFGLPLQSYDREALANLITYLPQSSFLITGSVFENVGYGLDTVARSEIVAAAKRARIHDEIESLPKGYETTVGEAGIKLSGGQRQRIALARIFLRRPKLILLDEATSNLDNINEANIQEELEAGGFTMLAIAHRLTTLRNADAIIVMDKGRIAERGTYHELIANGKLFSSLDAAGRLS